MLLSAPPSRPAQEICNFHKYSRSSKPPILTTSIVTSWLYQPNGVSKGARAPYYISGMSGIAVNDNILLMQAHSSVSSVSFLFTNILILIISVYYWLIPGPYRFRQLWLFRYKFYARAVIVTLGLLQFWKVFVCLFFSRNWNKYCDLGCPNNGLVGDAGIR